MRSQEFMDLLSLGFINVKTISDENLEAELSKGKGIIFYTFDGNNGNVVKCHAFFMKMPFDSWDSTLFLCSEYDNTFTVKGYRFESGKSRIYYGAFPVLEENTIIIASFM